MKTIVDRPLTKSFNPDNFQIDFNSDSYLMTLQGTKDPTLLYTKNVNVQDLMSGSVSFQIVSGEYQITFETIHGTPISKNTMDIKIDEIQTLNGTPITLQGILMDFLVVYDIQKSDNEYGNTVNNVSSSVDGSILTSLNGFYYGYMNRQTNLIVSYNTIFIDGFPKTTPPITQPLPTMSTGYLYWILKPLNGTFIIDIPKLQIVRILV